VGVVLVVDDEDAIRHSLAFQLAPAGYSTMAYASAEDFLEAAATVDVGCVLTDVRMPGLSGLEMVQKLNAIGFRQPIVMMTGHGDVPLAVEAMKAGVVDFIEKPLDDERLMRALDNALKRAAEPAAAAEEVRELRARFEALSPRERDVLHGVVAGKPNKIIAYDLGISPRTVEVYRAGLMSKTGAGSLSELVRMALALGL
jgi:two-component system response regulator FixJ